MRCLPSKVMMGKIPLGKIGKIVAGSEVGRFVKIADDTQSTGGFLILTSDRLDFREGFDNWVEDEDALRQYFHEAGWLIEWIE
jgi:hypothetical protein